MPMAASAAAPGLQVSPLEYQDVLVSGHIKTGYIDVSNPSDGPLTIQTAVKGFRQTGTDGTPEFFDAPELTTGIKVGLDTFDLGGREAVRVGFTVDPDKLPAGGVYAAIFFRTQPTAGTASTSYVTESANIGTILEFVNGPAGPHYGKVTKLTLPFWQFGSGLSGGLDYQNTDDTPAPEGFRPNLTVGITPWGNPPRLNTSLVLPGVTRHFDFHRAGAFIGLLPVTVTDSDTHKTTTQWVFALTGWWQWAVLMFVIIVVVLLVTRRRWTRFFKPRRRPKAAGRAKVAAAVLPTKPTPGLIVPAGLKLHPADHPELTLALVAQMLEPYGITEFTFEPTPSGIENTSLFVHAGETELVARVYRHGRATRQSILTELEFMRRLAAAHIPVATIRQKQTGEPVEESIGEVKQGLRSWYYIVMDRVPGEAPARYTNELIAELATYQARMHEVGAAYAEEVAPDAPVMRELAVRFHTEIDRTTIPDPAVLAFLDRAATYHVTLPGTLSTGYLHLDFDKENILTHEGAVSAIIDFDDLAVAPHVVCLGYTLLDVLSETGKLEKAKDYLRNYDLVWPLDPDDLEWLPAIMLFRHYVIGVIDIKLGLLKDEDFAEILELEQQLLELKPIMLK